MKKKHSTIDEYLLVKYFDGQASAHEVEQIKIWLDQDESNQQTLEQYQKIWHISSQIETDIPFEVNESAAWSKIVSKTGIQSFEIEERKSKKPEFRMWLYRIAAIFVLGIGIALMFFWLQLSDHTIEVYAAQGNETIILPDDSQITLHEGSSVVYPEEFTRGLRKVSMQGKVFFEITHNPDQPFVVEAQFVEVEVLGTSFFVDALSDEFKINIGVETGEVIVRSLQNDNYINLKAGEQAEYDKNTMVFSIKKVFDQNLLYWKTEYLEFGGSTLADVFEILSRIFDYDIISQNPELEKCRFSGRIAASGIDDVLEYLTVIFNLNYQKRGNEITIDGPGCPN